MGMAECDAERIGRIRLQFSGQAEEHLHHVLNLLLAGAPDTDQRLLDQPGRIFTHRQIRRDPGTNGGAARLAKLECRHGIARDEDFLDAHLGRPVLKDYGSDFTLDHAQALGQRTAAGGDRTVRNVVAAAAIAVDYAPAGRDRAGIDPDDANGCGHARFAVQPVAATDSSANEAFV